MPSWLTRIGMVRTLWAEARLAARLIREPRVPSVTKILPLLALLYVASPVDLVPDLIPVLGQLDDLALLLAVTQIFRRLAPSDVVAYHRTAVDRHRRYSRMPSGGCVIDAEWRREDT